jgi:hypothetical protein
MSHNGVLVSYYRNDGIRWRRFSKSMKRRFQSLDKCRTHDCKMRQVIRILDRVIQDVEILPFSIRNIIRQKLLQFKIDFPDNPHFSRQYRQMFGQDRYIIEYCQKQSKL